MPEVSLGRVRLKFILLCLVVALLALAAARPQLGSKLREEKARGIEMMLVVDISNSMLAEDFEPNRLERTKYAIGKLFEGAASGPRGSDHLRRRAQVQLPITSDYCMARALPGGSIPRRFPCKARPSAGALEQALLLLLGRHRGGRSRVIVLITDGENHEDDAPAAAQRAAQQGIRIYTIGIGTPREPRSRSAASSSRTSGGEMVVSKLNEEMLSADRRGDRRRHVRATKQDIGLDEVVREINDMEQSELSTVRFEEYNEQYQYLLIAALVLLLAEFLLLDRRNPLLAHLNIFREK